jgi:HK97 family phage portal protein
MAAKKQISKVSKGMTGDPGWGEGTFQGGVISAKALQAIDRTLGPAEAFALSIDLQSAQSAITNQFFKVPVRLFYARSGDEIETGDVVDFFRRPAPNYTTGAWLSELVNWKGLYGEIAASVLQAGKGKINAVPISPGRLAFQTPTNPRVLGDIQQWRYIWPNGTIDIINSDSLVYWKNFNPMSPVRGLSPVLAGVNEISAGYEAVAYNKRFFSNNAEPSHIVVLPDAISPEDKEAFEKEYMAMHSTYSGQSHRVMFVSGTNVEVKPISTQIKDAQFQVLQQMVTAKIAQLKKIPAAEMGVYDKTRFETIDAEREMFFENTLLPESELLTQVLQHQIVDRYFTNTKTTRAGGKKLSKSLMHRVEKARVEQGDSEILVVLDMDALPIALKVKQSKLAYAVNYQQAFKVSPRAAAEEIGIEIEETPANQQVWVQSTEAPYVDPAVAAQQAQDIAAAAQPDQVDANEPQEPDEQQASETDKSAAKSFAKAVRKLWLDAFDAGKLPKLADADKLNTSGNEKIMRQIRLDYVALKQIKSDDLEDRKDSVRSYLNKTYSRAFYRSL